MKFSLALIPLATLSSTIAAQGIPGWPVQQQAPIGQGTQQQYPPPYNPNQYGSWPPAPPQQQCLISLGQFPNMPDYEVHDWYSCTTSLLQSFNDKSQGSNVACAMWSCLHEKASKYSRGGALTSISNVLNPVCAGVGIFGNIVCDLSSFLNLGYSNVDDRSVAPLPNLIIFTNISGLLFSP
jgi:hypothetical protein